jgi:hypothetical protein
MRTRLIIPLFLLTSLGVSLAQTYTFAGLEFGSSSEAVKDTMLARGYEYDSEFEDEGWVAQTFRGEMLEWPITVTLVFDEYDRFTSATIFFYVEGSNIEERDAAVIRLYSDHYDALTARYGLPSRKADLLHVDGKLDSARMGTGSYFVTAVWAQSLATERSEAVNLRAGRPHLQGIPAEFSPSGVVRPDDIMVTLNYRGVPTSGTPETGKSLDDP